jgi:di/tricarboxylate transporter
MALPAGHLDCRASRTGRPRGRVRARGTRTTVAAAVATNLGYRSDPFLMAVAVALGCACDFLTPIGRQNNTLVMGPGGYRFDDYWRLGLPLTIMVLLVGTPLILHAWPLK